MVRQQIMEKPVRLITVVLTAVALGAATMMVGGGFWASAADTIVDREPSSSDGSIAYGNLVEDRLGERTYTSEVVAFNEMSGEVLTHLETGDEPNVVPDPSDERVYLLETYYTDQGCARGCEVTTGTAEQVLSVIDTQTWEKIDSTTITNRVQYTLAGPSALALSPDGTRLVVYSTDLDGDYWLELYDAETLEHVDDVTLPRGCGGTPIVTTRTEVALICGKTKEGSSEEGPINTPLALHFIDVNTAETTDSIHLPDSGLHVNGKPVGVEVADDGSAIYVVFNDLRIMEIDAATHKIRRNITTWLSDKPTVFGVELGSNGELLVGVASSLKTWENMRLLRFETPSLGSLESLSVQEYSHFAAGPNRTLYQWAQGSTDLRQLDLSDGSVKQIALGGEKELIADIVRSE